MLYPGKVSQYQVLNVEKPVESVQVTLQKTGPSTYRIDIANLPVSPEVDGKSLRILTDAPTMKEILIPIKLIN